MKLTFITNACCIYDVGGFKLLADPWLVPGAFGTWVHDPPLKTKPEDVKDVDALYISHIHPDHLCPETLKVFQRDIPIVTLAERLNLTVNKLHSLGFTKVYALEDGTPKPAGPLTLTVFGPFTKHPFHADACEIGNVVDSAMLVEYDGKKILNTNDNTPSLEAAEKLRLEYGPFTVAQLNFNNAGPYPACFDNLNRVEKIGEAYRCINRNLTHMVEVARILDATYTMPFAGAYKLGYGLEHLNEVLGTTSARMACERLTENKLRPLYLKEGESLEL